MAGVTAGEQPPTHGATRLGAGETDPTTFSHMRAFVARLRATSSFYRDRLGSVVDADLRDPELFRANVPLMEKSDTLADQASFPPFGARLVVERSEIRQVHLTSGTSGFGQEAFGLTEADVDATGDAWADLFRIAELVPGDVVAVHYPVTFLAVSRSLLEAGRRFGVVIVPVAGVDRGLTAELLGRLQPAALIGRAAGLTLLADAVDHVCGPAANLGIRAVLSAGLGPQQAAVLSSRFGASVFEYYGCSQIGSIAGGTCRPAGESAAVIHLDHSRWLFEVLDPDTHEAVGAGGEGELVLSTPYREASPLLRFRMGDRVVVADCDCGRGWGIEAGAIGRYDDMMKIRGNNVWPTQVDEAVLAVPGVLDYRAARTLDERGIDGMAVVVAGPPSLDVEKLARAVKHHTNVTPAVRVVGSLPGQDMKPRRWIEPGELEALR